MQDISLFDCTLYWSDYGQVPRFQFSFLLMYNWEPAGAGSRVWIPDTHLGTLGEVLGLQIWPVSDLGIANIWVADGIQISVCVCELVCVCLFHYNFQRNKEINF